MAKARTITLQEMTVPAARKLVKEWYPEHKITARRVGRHPMVTVNARVDIGMASHASDHGIMLMSR